MHWQQRRRFCGRRVLHHRIDPEHAHVNEISCGIHQHRRQMNFVQHFCRDMQTEVWQPHMWVPIQSQEGGHQVVVLLFSCGLLLALAQKH